MSIFEKMKSFYSCLFVLTFVFFCSSSVYGQSSTSPYEITLTILHPKKACEMDATSTCWSAKKITDPEWTFEIETIEKFHPVDSGEYDVKVKLGNDGYAVTYELIEIIAVREE
jgi:hypothetical protein